MRVRETDSKKNSDISVLGREVEGQALEAGNIGGQWDASGSPLPSFHFLLLPSHSAPHSIPLA